MIDKEFKCEDCGEPCDLIKDMIDYAGTHCTHGRPGRHWTGHWLSDCCGADYTDNEVNDGL